MRCGRRGWPKGLCPSRPPYPQVFVRFGLAQRARQSLALRAPPCSSPLGHPQPAQQMVPLLAVPEPPVRLAQARFHFRLLILLWRSPVFSLSQGAGLPLAPASSHQPALTLSWPLWRGRQAAALFTTPQPSPQMPAAAAAGPQGASPPKAHGRPPGAALATGAAACATPSGPAAAAAPTAAARPA
jgi:hypothetical protein